MFGRILVVAVAVLVGRGTSHAPPPPWLWQCSDPMGRRPGAHSGVLQGSSLAGEPRSSRVHPSSDSPLNVTAV